VAGGIRAVVELAPTFITIHASGGQEMLKRRGRSRRAGGQVRVPRPKLLGVTVLTSLDRSDLEATASMPTRPIRCCLGGPGACQRP